MQTNHVAVVLVAVVLGSMGCAAKVAAPAPVERKAPLFDDLGNLRHPISTKSELAQRYFDQGLTLSYGFNHAEAARSFREATRYDPQCAMCYWGVALVLGPNINAPMDPADVPEAYEASRKALALSEHASEKERAYIEALTQRYAQSPPADRAPLDQAYADAMRGVAQQYPDDLDATALFVEALMDVHPWDYWNKDGTAQPWTNEITTSLEVVLARDPNHIGAIHFYIHAVEASTEPERAEPYADRLGDLVPGAGHLVHMPAHTYIRVGRYHDAVLVNIRAAQADNSYVTQCRAQGIYPLAYVPHNHHFLWAAASMEGWRAQAIEAALMTDQKTHHEMMAEPGMGALQHFSLIPLYAYVRFGMWDEILAYRTPPQSLLYPTGIWHYARGRAFVGKRQVDAAREELEALREIAKSKELEKVTIWDINSAASLLQIAQRVLAGEIDAAQRNFKEAIQQLNEAVRLEDDLRYTEPADWQYPVRQSLGAVLLEAGKPKEAEAVYREDLRRNPENGWSLFGLMVSLQAQGRTADAAKVEERFEKAWAHADVQLSASRY
jgi:tetratricopeptide (TPR) repeat protein